MARRATQAPAAGAGRALARGAALKAEERVPLWRDLRPGDLVLVDTAPLIYVLEDHPRFAEVFAGLFECWERGELRIAVSTVSVAELLVGPLSKSRDALARRYEQALAAFELVNLDPVIAALAARLRARHRLRLPHAIQAATALEIGAAALVTHDRDFSRLEGVRVIAA